MRKLISLPLKIMLFTALPIVLFFSLMINAQSTKQYKHVIIGYVGGYHGLIDTTLVDPHKITILNYAFVNLRGNRAVLTNIKTDTVNFKYLLKLKKQNPDLKVVISIGGWGWSNNFSDAVLSDTSRAAFVASAVKIVRKYHLDGIDIDWEYPGLAGIGNIHRDADKQNYTLMFQGLRKGLDSIQNETGKKLLLTAAVGAFKGFLQHTEMGKVATYLNYVNLMTYDFSGGDTLAIHHTNLYTSKSYSSSQYSAITVTDFETAGVPANKLVMGIAFYGHTNEVIPNDQHGLGVKTIGSRIFTMGGYTYIRDSLMNNKDFKYYRDKDAKAPYLYNDSSRQFISFDDEWSVSEKCKYVRKNDMAGVMFWEYAGDKKGYLLNEIDKGM
jgi:chitinase